jgi:hypothetical protein
VERSKQGIGAIVLIVLAGILSTWAPDAPGAAAVDGRNPALVSGGVGKEEADSLRTLAPQYPLELVFVRRVDNREEFVADVRLTIADGGGRVLVDQALGPIVLVRVPDGVYTVSAEYGGQMKTRRIAVVDGRHEKVSLVWS